MKRLLALIFAMLLVFGGTVQAVGENVTTRIDYAAIQWYAQAANAAFVHHGLPFTMSASDDQGAYSLSINYRSQYNETATFEEALTAEELPVDLLIFYGSSGNTVAFVFGTNTITETPLSVEAFADGVHLQGEVIIPPAGSDPATSISGFCFDLNAVDQIMTAQDVFIRLVTDKRTSYIEISGENMLLPYCMLGLVYSGAEYGWKDSPYYLDKAQIWDEIQNWQPQGMTSLQTTEPLQTKSFQTDYEAIDKAAQSVFLLEVYDSSNQLIATGSGFVAFNKGTMITNEHVVKGGSYVIAYGDKYKSTYKLTKAIAINEDKDIAILEFDKSANVQPLMVDCTTNLLRGQPVIAIGSPQSILNTVSSGNISNIYYLDESIPDAIQFTAPISPGSSGGALFNDQGKIIGLCAKSRTDANAVYLAIPIKYVVETYKEASNYTPKSLEEYYGLQHITDPLSGVTFSVPKNWPAPTFVHEILGTTGRLDIGFFPDQVSLFTFACQDLTYLPTIQAYTSSHNLSRNTLDILFSSRAAVSKIYDLPENSLKVLDYAGKQYYGYTTSKNGFWNWYVFGVNNGFMYTIGWNVPEESITTNSKVEMIDVAERIINSIHFP